MRRPGNHWFITGLGIGQICSWGSLYYSYPLIAEAMGKELGWSKPQLYGAATVGLILAGLLAYPVGVLIDRGQGRRVMTGASVLAGLLLLAWSQVTDLTVFWVLAAAVGALQAATLYEPAFAVVAWRLGPTNSRADITQLTLWGGFASTVFVPLVQWLIDHGGWRGALIGLAVVNLVICAGLYASVIGSPQQGARSAPAAAGEGTSRSGGPPGARAPGAVRAALRKPVFWAFAIALIAHSATFSAFTFHLYPMLMERGFSAGDVVTAMVVIGPAQVAGRILVGAFARRLSVRWLGAVVVTFFPIALGALYLLPATVSVAVGIAMVYGAANGIFTIVRGLAVPEMISRTDYGAINGALTAPATLARAVAPLGAAMMWTMSGSYDTVLLATIAGALVLTVGFWSAAALARPT